ncbi:MAG: TolC family protein [Paramuribaculum sp.]|nr:TolC family protein [Paramuribaculum sp.]
MHIKPILTSLTLFYSITIPATAVADSLDIMAKSIVENNGAYQLELAKAEADILDKKIANNLEDPEISVSHVWGAEGIGNKFGIEVSQSFDWPGVYSARSEAVAKNSLALKHLAEANRIELILQAKCLLIDLSNAAMKRNAYRNALKVIDSLSVIVAKDVERKEVSILDGNKLKIERISISRKYNDAVNVFNDAYVQLIELNGGKARPDIVEYADREFTLPSLRSLDDYLLESANANPEMSYRAQLNKLNLANEKVAKLESLPGFSVGLRHELEQGDRFNGFSVSMSLPFLSSRGKKKAAKAQTVASELETDRISVSTRARITGDYNSAKQLMQEISEYKLIIEAEDNLRLLNRAFEARHISVLDYISDLVYFTDATCEYLDLNHAYRLKLASLERYSLLK